AVWPACSPVTAPERRPTEGRRGVMELHILLVGDDADHADAMRRALVRMEAGVRVTTAARLERALEALRDPAIRCVVTDVRLPDADGVRVLQALRRARRELPVIVVTANGSEELAVAAMALGAAHYASRHARPPPPRPAPAGAFPGAELRRPRRSAPRERALRPRARRLHRRRARPPRALRRGRPGHRLPRRDRRGAAGRAGEAAPRPPARGGEGG